MASVLLISETKLKNFTYINQNLDQALITAGIYIAQDIHLQTLIGTKGLEHYTQLVKSVQLSGGTMSNADRIMLDEYIAPYLLWYSYYETLPEIWSRKMNKGIQVGASEQSNPIDIKGMQYFRDNTLSKAQFYGQRLLDRVQAFSGDYPWFYSYSNKDGMPSTNQPYFGGIHFRNGMRRPPIKTDWYGNLPAYQGPEYDACVNC